MSDQRYFDNKFFSFQFLLILVPSAATLGLYFNPVARMTYSGMAYIVPYKVMTSDLTQPLYEITEKLDNLVWESGSIKSNDSLIAALRTHMTRLNDSVTHTAHDLQLFLDFYITPSNRKARGAIDIVGTLANSLFGTATQSQVDVINSNLHKLSELSEVQRKTLNVHSAILNATVRNQVTITSALNNVINATRIAQKLLNQYSTKTLQLEKDLKVAEILSLLQGAYGYVANELAFIISGFKTMMGGHISPFFFVRCGFTINSG